ncbi:MAG TPA: hypothetical protein VFE59_08935 [Trebonia sp.]|jgi:hypothetical protein|nr:hypothetical protein [Trebonia sp.]
MDKAAPQAARTAAADEIALAELRWGWGEAYRIGWDTRRGYWANRRDGKGGDLTADNQDVLWAAIFADYTANPVRRDYSAPLADSGECHGRAGAAR